MKNITALTVSMNRTEDLISCIESCQNIDSLSKHVVIDFSSDIPVSINNDKVDVIRVENERSWWITRAYNAGLEFIKTEYLLKIDADVVIDANYFNKLKYTEYDHILFTNNDNDAGNFLVKNKIIQEVNGFNEYIYNRHDDLDLFDRIKTKSNDLNLLKVTDGITKKAHGDDKRMKSNKSIFLAKNESYHYGLVKATNDYGGLISTRNLWDSSKIRRYDIKNSTVQIKHTFSHKDFTNRDFLKSKKVFLDTFFRIYFRRKSSLNSKLLKRVLPLFLLFTPMNLIKTLFGFEIFPRINRKLP
jgi:hypothetical protein